MLDRSEERAKVDSFLDASEITYGKLASAKLLDRYDDPDLIAIARSIERMDMRERLNPRLIMLKVNSIPKLTHELLNEYFQSLTPTELEGAINRFKWR